MLSLTVSLTEGATGLTHLDARWYNPYSQRFVQPDYWSFQNTGLPLEIQHELLRFSRLDTTKLLSDPSQQLAYGYVAGNALAWNDQMGLGLFKKRTAEEKAQRKRNRQYSKAMKKTQRAYKKQIGKNQTRKEKRKKFTNGLKNFAGRVTNAALKIGFEAGIAYRGQFNTKIGFAIGATFATVGFVGKALGLSEQGPSFGFGNRALQFKNLPFIMAPMSLGNVHLYPEGLSPDKVQRPTYLTPDNFTIGEEEGLHTIQSGILGSGYVAAHLFSAGVSMLTKPSPQVTNNNGTWHGNNILELGPMKGQLLP